MTPIQETQARPSLTVVLPTWDSFDALRTTVEHLAAQTTAGSIELLICAPSLAHARVDEKVTRGLHSVRVLETGPLRETGPMRARAVREASADIVAFAEDHCFPFPDWAEALLAAHGEPYAAVGPAVHNANPESRVSWADFILEYGRWAAPGRRQEVELLPGHNSSYKRDVLLQYGDALDSLMEAETVLFWDLRRRGYTLLFEPAARVRHTNFSGMPTYLRVMWDLGRSFAAKRAEPWSPARRAGYALASPAIPLIRLSHIARMVVANNFPWRRLFSCSPVLLAALAVDCVAQATGAAFGAGQSIVRLTSYEFHRAETNRTGRPPARS